jgi:hypothetical protein
MRSPPELDFVPGHDFHLDVTIHRRDDMEAVPGTERLEYLREMTCSNIKRLSHTGKKKGEIKEWVNQNFPKPCEMTSFVQKIPLTVITLISRGVAHFAKRRAELPLETHQ